MSYADELMRQMIEEHERAAGVLGKYQVWWGSIEKNIRALWFMKCGENKFCALDEVDLQRKVDCGRPKAFRCLVKATIPEGELEISQLFSERLDARLKGEVPDDNLRKWLLETWDSRNLVIHGSLGYTGGSIQEMTSYVMDTECFAKKEAVKYEVHLDGSDRIIMLSDLVDFTDEARKVCLCLERVRMNALRDEVAQFPLRIVE